MPGACVTQTLMLGSVVRDALRLCSLDKGDIHASISGTKHTHDEVGSMKLSCWV